MSRFRRILHPTDFSRASTPAFERAVEVAKDNRSELVVAHVLGPVMPMMVDGYVSPKVYEDMDAAARSAAQKQLRKLIDKAKQAGVRAKGLLLDGLAHERIARAAKAQKADLIVIGTHGRTGVAKLFLGSVASRVLAVSPCPVLTVRGK